MKTFKTELDFKNNPHHKALVGVLVTFVDDLGYSPRDLFELLKDCEQKLFFHLMEIHEKKH